jgi:hypothetical protein
MTAFVNAMLAQQLEDASADFHQQIDRLRQAMDGLAGDASTIQGLRDLAVGREAGKENLLHRLEADIAGAQRLVVAMADSKRQSVVLGDSAAAAAAKLGLGIVEIQDIKTDVQHMAINTSLKCARIGDEGKPLAVIAVELRHHSGQIETLALSALSGLDAVAEEAGRLVHDSAATAEDGSGSDTAAGIGVWLEEVRTGLQQSSAMVEADLATLAAQGAAVATTLRHAAGSLDLRAEIGAVLDETAAALNREADPDPSHVSDLEGPLGALLGKAGALYTMASEREAHATTVKGLAFALPDSRPTVAAKPAASVDDMFF